MKSLVTTRSGARLLLILLSVGFLAAQSETVKALRHSTSYFGNTFNGQNDQFIQGDALGLAVLPDGRFYVNSVWDEGSREAGIYQGTKVIGKLKDTHGWGRLGGGAICTDNSRFVFMAMRQSYDKAAEGRRGFPQNPKENWYAIRRFTLAGDPAPFISPGALGYQDEFGADGSMQTVSKDKPGSPDGAYVQGLAIGGGRLYASDYAARKIRVYDANTFHEQSEREFQPQKDRIPFQIAAAANGKTLWVIERQSPYGAASIAEYSLNGKPTGKQITGLDDPASISFSPAGQLILGDDGPRQTVDVFDVSAAPRRVTSIGEPGGMFGTNPGKAGPYRFNGITGAGMDGRGNLMVTFNGAGVDLRPTRDLKIKAEPGKIGEHHAVMRVFHSASANGSYKFVSEIHSFVFVDMVDVAGNDLFTTQDRFSVPAQLTGAGGQLNSTWVGTHLNRFAYPGDPRLYTTFATAWIRTVKGKQLLYLTSMYPTQGLAVYRFDGQIAVPAAILYLDAEASASLPPAHHGPAGAWIWTDADGNGRADPGEVTASPSVRVESHTWAWQVDTDGSVWAAPEHAKAGQDNTVFRLRIESFNSHGVPVYQEWKDASTYTVPAAQLDRIERIYYLPASDEMWVTGYLPGDKQFAKDWGFLGTAVLHYQAWDAAARRKETPHPAATLTLPYNLPAKKSRDYPKTMDIAGGRLFVGYLVSAQILVYDLARLTLTGRLQPDFQSSWIDLPYGIRALERDGSLYLFAEENLYGKNIIYKIAQ
jgi:DNA-binding beta-propeller fold protein YncE